MHEEDIQARERFLYTLEWFLEVVKRHSGRLQFGLAYIHYNHPDILGDTFGAKEASKKLDDVSHILRKIFRKSDLIARGGMDFWILVPYTPINEKLVDKINDVVDTASRDGLQIVEHDVYTFSLDKDVVDFMRKFLGFGISYISQDKLH